MSLQTVLILVLAVGSPDAKESRDAVAQLEAHLKQPGAGSPALAACSCVSLTKKDAERARALLWKQRVTSLRASRRKEFESKVITLGGRDLRFEFTRFGEKPPDGWSLFISLHGGGNAPARVNDRQWENQKRLYKLKQGYYVAPRAPTNTWNLWHEAHIDALFDRLIEDFVVLADVDPNHVYVMGYSAGGDGVYQLAPRMADRWAAAAMMAGHPNETSPLGLRNVPFTLHAGGNDAAYKRNEVAKSFGERLAKLHEADPKGYVHEVKIHEGLGHWMQRRDAVAVDWMAQFARDPVPERIVWKQDDVVHGRFYWLGVDEKQTKQKERAEFVVERDGQTIRVEKCDLDSLVLLLDDRMLDLDKEVVVVAAAGDGDGDATRELFRGRIVRTIGNLAKSLEERGDPELVFSGRLVLSLR